MEAQSDGSVTGWKATWEMIPLSLIESAFLLGTLRRLIRSADFPPAAKNPHLSQRGTSRSLAYFLPVITELQQQPLPEGYLAYFRLKLQKLAKACRLDVRNSKFSDER